METSLILDALAKPSGSDEVQRLLAACGHTKALRPKRGETGVDLEFFRLGVALSFEEPDESSTGLSEGSQVLVAAFLYGSAHPEYDRYCGSLPLGLTFDDDRMMANAKVGATELWSEDFLSSTWERDGITVIASYGEGASRIEQIQISR